MDWLHFEPQVASYDGLTHPLACPGKSDFCSLRSRSVPSLVSSLSPGDLILHRENKASCQPSPHLPDRSPCTSSISSILPPGRQRKGPRSVQKPGPHHWIRLSPLFHPGCVHLSLACSLCLSLSLSISCDSPSPTAPSLFLLHSASVSCSLFSPLPWASAPTTPALGEVPSSL